MRRVFTIGTSERSFEEFLSLLRLHKIQAVADVRRFPTSRWEHFKKEAFQGLLEAEGIEYFYLGKELGGFRQGGYQTYMETEEFQKGLERLEEIASGNNLAIVCAERFPWRCHRRFIAFALESRGWEVVHIISEDRDWIKRRKEV
ncbi:MAG: DUF488 domain-containing protein [Caldiserica bacterium]|jgi:uncharacterized protein (DUF488 family)|nr:DUF488 domain-containing protein [Caldisericota bacterium]